MSIFDTFKTGKKKIASPKHQIPEKPKFEKAKTVREELEAVTGKAPRKGRTVGQYGHSVLLRPVVSEKSAHLHSFNQYVFKIAPNANKIMVKKAIFEVYNAEPTDVRIIRVRGKNVTRGKTHGRTSAYKKAVIRMPKGVTLPIYEGV